MKSEINHPKYTTKNNLPTLNMNQANPMEPTLSKQLSINQLKRPTDLFKKNHVRKNHRKDRKETKKSPKRTMIRKIVKKQMQMIKKINLRRRRWKGRGQQPFRDLIYRSLNHHFPVTCDSIRRASKGSKRSIQV